MKRDPCKMHTKKSEPNIAQHRRDSDIFTRAKVSDMLVKRDLYTCETRPTYRWQKT